MIPEASLAAVVFALVGLLCGFLGFRIRSRGDVHLIAGYEGQRVEHPESVARLVGGMCYVLAFAAIGVSAVLVARPSMARWAVLAFGVMAVGGVVIVLGARSK